MSEQHTSWQTLRWEGGIDGCLMLIDQTRLPTALVECRCTTVDDVWQAIQQLRVRGAPAIGIAAAYGVVLGLRDTGLDPAGGGDVEQQIRQVIDHLASSRPTAVNLFWALQRMEQCALGQCRRRAAAADMRAALLREAIAIHEEDRAMCRAIGHHGQTLLSDGMGILTHCNAGWLATAEYGTALAAIYAAQEAGKRIHVFADETRPLLQGARLTAWELTRRGVDTTLICDAMAAQVMREGRVQAVITGADRIAANGDVANKIGTYSLALLARAHQLPFYVAAPSSTFDLALDSGELIPIEQRSAEEITCPWGIQLAPPDVSVYNPAFDVTPAELVTAIITEQGIIRPVEREGIRQVLARRA